MSDDFAQRHGLQLFRAMALNSNMVSNSKPVSAGVIGSAHQAAHNAAGSLRGLHEAGFRAGASVVFSIDAARSIGNEAKYTALALSFAPFSEEDARDAIEIQSSRNKAIIYRWPLWRRGTQPALQDLWNRQRKELLRTGNNWKVWTDWYEARERGDPIDPTLEEAAILISEDLWQAGPKAANSAIATRISERRAATHSAMLDRIAALEARLAETEAARPAPRGHNNPPEPMDDEVETIRAGLETLKTQPAAPTNPSAAVRAARDLRAALERMTGSAGEKLDLFMTEAAKEGGKWAGRAIAGNLAVLLYQVVGAAITWLRALGAPI